MDPEILLNDSIFCRLCCEENENGIPLFTQLENEQDLCSIINRYLPIQIKDDGKLPRTICPGCNIQLDAMVQFLDLIINGQMKLRELWRTQQSELKRKEKEKLLLEQSLFHPDAITPFTIQALEENGKEICLQIMPDGSIYAPEHEISLRIEGLEKPKRKRGRPPKQPIKTDEIPESEMTKNSQPEPEPDVEEEEEDDDEEIEFEDGQSGTKRKRRRKIPKLFQEALQGEELERMLREEGVVDEEDDPNDPLADEISESTKLNDNEIIGHLENKDGEDLGEYVVQNKYTKERLKKYRKRKNFPCKICGRTFLRYRRYLLHKSIHKRVQYKCMECMELFETKDELTEHQTKTEHTGENVVESVSISDEKSKCEQCGKEFVTRQGCETHVKGVHEGQKPYNCEKCERAFAYQASFKSHLSTHEVEKSKMYPCDLCEKQFSHPSSIMYHKEAEHNNGRRFVCNKCGKSFKHKQLLQRHQLVHSDDRPYACKLCAATFKTKPNLVHHQQTHSGVKKYYCQQCGQQFAHKTSLTLHYRWHSGQKPYECNVCQKTFSQKGNLEEHKRIHTGEKPYTCEFCSRKFTTSSQFKLHIKRHTGERPWSCEYCSKSFLHKDTWKCHMRRHRNERPFQCNACLRDFTEQWALKKHLRLHTGEKPYVCEICNKAFADCSNLTKHKKTHRNNVQDGTIVTGTEGNNVYYVTYQTEEDVNQVPALVQFLNESDDNHTETISKQENSTDFQNELITSPNHSTDLQLEDDSIMPLTSGQLNVTDEEGNPIYFTAQDGQQVRVTSFDGENLQMCMDDGSIIPIQINNGGGGGDGDKTIELPELLDKDLRIDNNQIIIPEISDQKNNEILISNDTLINQPLQFVTTSDGQNMCFVSTFLPIV